jgi:hypothetical protein
MEIGAIGSALEVDSCERSASEVSPPCVFLGRAEGPAAMV